MQVGRSHTLKFSWLSSIWVGAWTLWAGTQLTCFDICTSDVEHIMFPESLSQVNVGDVTFPRLPRGFQTTNSNSYTWWGWNCRFEIAYFNHFAFYDTNIWHQYCDIDMRMLQQLYQYANILCCQAINSHAVVHYYVPAYICFGTIVWRVLIAPRFGFITYVQPFLSQRNWKNRFRFLLFFVVTTFR